MKEITGIISSIQRMSTEDGPGIRTTIFMKGCNMHCVWCHNPEAIKYGYSLGVDFSNCNFCRKCIPICPTSALSIVKNHLIIDRSKCIECLKCAKECFFNVFTTSGKKYTSTNLINEILRDKQYFIESNGGVTFSGGEPLCQKEFLLKTMLELEKYAIKTCLQSNFSVPFDDTLLEISKHCDTFYIDLKFSSDHLSKKWTGIGLKNIHDNLLKLDKINTRIFIRTPVVEGINDNIEELANIAYFVKQLKHLEKYYLVPYHPLGLIKYKQFGIKINYNNQNFYDTNKLQKFQKDIDLIMEN